MIESLSKFIGRDFVCLSLDVLRLYDDWDCEKRSAYKDISMEREARFSERDSHYLDNSNYFAWLKEI